MSHGPLSPRHSAFALLAFVAASAGALEAFSSSNVGSSGSAVGVAGCMPEVSYHPGDNAERHKGFGSPRVALVAAGITPASLAAAGLTANDAISLFATAAAAWTIHQASLGAAIEAVGTMSAAYQTLDDRARSGKLAQEELSALAMARDARTDARAARDEGLTEFRATVTANLLQEQKEALTLIIANRKSSLPIEYRVLQLNEEECIAVRAIAAEARRAARLGLEAPTHVLSQDRRDAISSAEASLATNLPEIEILWNQIVAQ